MDSDKYRYIEYIFFLYIGIMELNELFMLLFRLGEFSVAKFTKRIEQLGFDKFPDFSKYGKMTFFLPIDQAFGVSKNWIIELQEILIIKIQNLRVELIDEDVVRAHVVPEELLFTLPPKRRPELFPTIQYNYTKGISNLEVKAKVSTKDNGKQLYTVCIFWP